MRKFAILFAFVGAFGLFVAPGCGGDDDDDGDANRGNPAEVGSRCETDEDCETGNCYTGSEIGYCTTECSEEGELEACPADTVCKPIQGMAPRCLLICGSETACADIEDDTCEDDWCPGSSSCVSVSNTDASACEPDPN